MLSSGVLQRWIQQLGLVLILLVGPTLGAATHAQTNSPPIISGSPPPTATVGRTYSFRPTASDPNGDALTFSIRNKPVWASFSSSTGRLHGTPGSGRIGTYSNIVIRVSDGRTSTALPPFSITVVPANSPPTISGSPPPTATVGRSYSFRPTASDANGDALTFSIANRPAWASFSSSTGRLSGAPGSTRVGTYSNIVISVSDGRASAALPPFSITVVAANSPPTISGSPPPTATVGRSYSFRPNASDPNGDALTFSIANRPSWASFNSRTGRLSGTPGSTRVGTYPNIVISVSDGRASTALPAFTITVVAANSPPTMSGSPPPTVTVGRTYSFRPTASDPNGDDLTFSIANRPAWASFSSSTGRLYGTPGSTRVGTYSNIVISVSDGRAITALPPFSITVVAANSPPTISGSPPPTVTVGSTYSFRPAASDANGDPLTFSIANKPAWASFSSSTGRLYGTPAASHIGTYSNIVISVSDGRASAALPPFSINVAAAQGPATGSATVSWSPPVNNEDGSPLTNLAGYRVVYGLAPSNLSNSVVIESPLITSAVIEALTSGTWYFAVKAYTTAGVESDLSNVVHKTIN